MHHKGCCHSTHCRGQAQEALIFGGREKQLQYSAGSSATCIEALGVFVDIFVIIVPEDQLETQKEDQETTPVNKAIFNKMRGVAM